MNRKKIAFASLASFSLIIAGTSVAASSLLLRNEKVIGVKAEAEGRIGETLDVTTLEFANTPQAGWGSVNRNKTCDGANIVVNGITYEKGFGTHIHDNASSTAADMDFDISSLSSTYEFFEAKVAMPDGGNNLVHFIVLVDGVEKDDVYWRKGNFNDGNPIFVRCSIKGGSTLTLRTMSSGFGYANGTSVWIDPILFNVGGDKVYASDILDRHAATEGGWDYTSGEGFYRRAQLDERVNAHQFSSMVLYGEACNYTKGIGGQLVNGSYAAYELDKSDPTGYASYKWDIKGKDYAFFDTTAVCSAGAGYHIESWIDGVEAAHVEVPTASIHGLNVAIPSSAEEFEIRVIPTDGIADGLYELLGAAFHKDDGYLWTKAAEVELAPLYQFPAVRGCDQHGSPLMIHDSEASADVAAEKAFYMHLGGSITFDVEGTDAEFFSAKVGVLGGNTSYAGTNFKADLIYKDSTVKTYTSLGVTYASSRLDFVFTFDNTNISKIKLYLDGNVSFSSSVWEAAKIGAIDADLAAAIAWAKDFNTAIEGVCDFDGVTTNPTTLATKWGEVKTSFEALSSAAQDYVKNNGLSDEDIVAAREKYDYVADKYDSLDDFLGRIPNPTGANWVTFTLNNQAIPAIIVAIILLSTMLVVIVISKKRRVR